MKKRLIVLIGLLAYLGYQLTYDYRMERRVRSQVVKLQGEKGGSCSGSHVRINEKVYILSAGHCQILENEKGEILVNDDNMSEPIPRRILQEDKYSDLLLLESLPGRQGLSLANHQDIGDKLISFTHGLGMATHRTEGELIQIQFIDIINFIIKSQADEDRCTAPKNKIEEVQLLFFKFRACLLHVEEIASTMFSSPGSSGGAVVNSSGQLVGVVSAGGQGYSFSVPLKQIKNFLENWK